MVLDISLTVDTDRFDKLSKGFPSLFARNLGDALEAIGLDHERAVNRAHRAPPARGGGLLPRKSPGSGLSRLTGQLMSASSHGTTVRRSTAVRSILMERFIGRGLPDRRAVVHEFGATIRPKRARVLAVPTVFARTQGGDARGSVRDFKGFWRTTQSGALIFFGTEPEGLAGSRRAGGLVPLFLGLDSVTIPPRLKFFSMWAERKPSYDAALGRMMDHTVAGRSVRVRVTGGAS